MARDGIAYRRDIDGLRAIAVLLVVFNHVGFAAFSGGFIGVDVFFVISGYLITGIVSGQLRRGSFSFREFYRRRALRILPALYVVLVAVMIAGYYILIPSDYSVLSLSSLSAMLFVSNIFFSLSTGGYFSASADDMPLLHVWSLSVEEQFYLLWPVALLLLMRLKSKRKRLFVIGLVTTVSFALAQVGVARGLNSAYFLLHARAGELLIGALLAFLGTGSITRPNHAAANALSLAGIAMILVPAVLLDRSSEFPGLAAALPCLGAALVILGPKFGSNLVTSILSTKPLVGVGLISYSVYLWHWPIVSFLHYSNIAIDLYIAASIVAGSLLAGYLSWRFVEQVFRHREQGLGFATRFYGGLLLMATAVLPATVYLQQGVPSRFPYAMLTQEQLDAERARYWQGVGTIGTVFDDGDKSRNVLVIGNSHAFDFSYALSENGFQGKIKLISTGGECFNFSHDAITSSFAGLCRENLRNVLESEDLPKAGVIYLHDSWGGVDLKGLTEMIGLIRQRSAAKIYVVGPKMLFSESVLSISKQAQQERLITAEAINEYSRHFANPSPTRLDRVLKDFFSGDRFPGVRYVSALDVQCGPELRCNILSANGQYLYFDNNHFTLEGSREFGQRLKRWNAALF